MLMSIEEVVQAKPEKVALIENEPGWGMGKAWTALYIFEVAWDKPAPSRLGVQMKKIEDISCKSVADAKRQAAERGIPRLADGPFCPF